LIGLILLAFKTSHLLPLRTPVMSPTHRTEPAQQPASPSRRQFIGSSITSGALATAAVTFGAAAIHRPQSAYAGGTDDVLRVGLIGCGGRGTGAARQALLADERVKLVAMADVFEPPLRTSLQSLSAIRTCSPPTLMSCC
jgi:hypothetical protein